jgi:glycosyltransferase involved in cell wall biosynthesis
MTSVGVAVLTRDEERCVARCLDSVTGKGFADVLVVDTGSTDRTTDIVSARDGVRLARVPWPRSFAAVRNHALAALNAEWIVFVDADEWLPPDSVAPLLSLPDGEVLAPRIRDVDHHTVVGDVPRIFRADSGIHYRGPVHEYVVRADGSPVDLVRTDIEFLHDGYNPDVARAKDKRNRNLALLDTAIEAEPDNPRWPCFRIRDAGLEITADHITRLCAVLRDLAGVDAATGDTQNSLDYHRIAVGYACQALVAKNEWDAVLRVCDDLDAVERHTNPDTHYFRSMSAFREGVVTGKDLLASIRIREDDRLVATSRLDPAGRHLDALIGLQLEIRKGQVVAGQYRELCQPWTDGFFERSLLRRA